MIKTTKSAALGLVGGVLFASAANAGPLMLSDAAMDTIVAGDAGRVAGFVCPVITTSAVYDNGPGIAISDGHYSIVGPDVAVPVFATNDGGAGSPGGAHAAPGDRSYTAIWAN